MFAMTDSTLGQQGTAWMTYTVLSVLSTAEEVYSTCIEHLLTIVGQGAGHISDAT
jgi:hypothetical protein